MHKERWLANKVMRLMLEAARDVLRPHGLNAVLSREPLVHYIGADIPDNNLLEIPGEDLAALMQGILTVYGEKNAQRLFLHCGHALAHKAVNRPLARFFRLILGLLPPEERAEAILHILVQIADQARGETLHTLADDGEAFILEWGDCLHCQNTIAHQPLCAVITGIIEELLAWGVNRQFQVSEVECRATGGDVCRFRVSKQGEST